MTSLPRLLRLIPVQKVELIICLLQSEVADVTKDVVRCLPISVLLEMWKKQSRITKSVVQLMDILCTISTQTGPHPLCTLYRTIGTPTSMIFSIVFMYYVFMHRISMVYTGLFSTHTLNCLMHTFALFRYIWTEN